MGRSWDTGPYLRPKPRIVHQDGPRQALKTNLVVPRLSTYKQRENQFSDQGTLNAAKPPTTRRASCGLARPWRGEVRRGFLLREVRRHACAGHGDARRPHAAMAQGAGAWLGDGRIRHAAARHQ